MKTGDTIEAKFDLSMKIGYPVLKAGIRGKVLDELSFDKARIMVRFEDYPYSEKVFFVKLDSEVFKVIE